MKIIYSIIIILFAINELNCQELSLVYDCRKDSNDYIANLKIIHGEIFFNSGRYNPKGTTFCYRLREFKESHVYKLNDDYTSSKVFHHDLENDCAKEHEQKLDSSKIFDRSSFIEFSDTTGVFLSYSGKNEYWIKSNNKFYRERLPEGKTVSSYYPKWFDEMLIVNGKDTISDGRLWYFNKHELKLKELVSDTFLYMAHNHSFFDDYIIFHGYSKKLGKDNALFISDKSGKVSKITDYEPVTIFVQFQTIYKNKLIYRITHRGVKGSHSYKDYTNTELWEYDFDSGDKKRIFNFGKYGLTYSATEFGDKLYFLYGLGNHRLFELHEGDITENNDLSNSLDSIHEQNQIIYKFENKLYFIATSKDKILRLYNLDINGNIQLVDERFQNVKHLQVIANKLFFSAIFEESNCREIYLIEPENNEIQKISDLCLTNSQSYVSGEVLGDKIFFKMKNTLYNFPSTDLFYFDKKLKKVKLIFQDIKNETYYYQPELKVLGNQVFFISREKENARYNQIWKIE